MKLTCTCLINLKEIYIVWSCVFLKNYYGSPGNRNEPIDVK